MDYKVKEHLVSLGENSYKIFFGNNIIANSQKILTSYINNNKIIVVFDSSIEKTHLPKLLKALNILSSEIYFIKINSGEKSKSFKTLEMLIKQILNLDINRNTILVAFGGGVIGDLVGFAASILLRGIKYIQIPTTLLAQVDSSIGGKTGINTIHGKNLVGSFNQPVCVLTDFLVLDTLDTREIISGYAEIVKYGLIIDEDFFNWLEQNSKIILNNNSIERADAIIRSCKIKSNIVEKDEFESNQRAFLNLGHTFAHAFESLAKYKGSLLHGEAVSIGIVQAFKLAYSIGLCKFRDFVKVKNHFKKNGLPYNLDSLPIKIKNTKKIWQIMQKDKKNTNGNVNFILPKSIGNVILYDKIKSNDLEIIFEEFP